MTYTSGILCFLKDHKQTPYNTPYLLFANLPYFVHNPKAEMRISKPPTLPVPLAIAKLLTFIFTGLLALTLYLSSGRTTTMEYESIRQEGYMVGENIRCFCCCSAGTVFNPGSRSVIPESREVNEILVASGSGMRSIYLVMHLMLGLLAASLLGIWWYWKGCSGALAEPWKTDIKRKTP
jgi:hypothetical protein